MVDSNSEQDGKNDIFFDNLGHYSQLAVLGAGTFGVVIKAADTRAEAGQHEVAIKLLQRGEFISSFRTYVEREIMHQGCLKHPFIVALKEVFLTSTHIAIVMEYARGGDLLRYTLKTYPQLQQEEQARWIFQQLIVGLDFCHKMGVANRDLKLENLLIDQDDTGKRPLLKICDFGYSKHEMNSSAKSGVGTPIFMAPEIIFSGKKYDAKRADIWSCGVILYAQIYGRYPFDSKAKDYARKFHKAEYSLPPEVPASDLAKDLLKKLLVADPEQRISLEDIMKHPWFQDSLPTGALLMNEYYLAKAPKFGANHKINLEAIMELATRIGQPSEPYVSLNFAQPDARSQRRPPNT